MHPISDNDVALAEAISSAIKAVVPVILAVIALFSSRHAVKLSRRNNQITRRNSSRLEKVETALQESDAVNYPPQETQTDGERSIPETSTEVRETTSR